MPMEDCLKGALSDPGVISSVRTILNQEEAKGFLIYANEGIITHGNPERYRHSHQYGERLEQLRETFLAKSDILTPKQELVLLGAFARAVRPHAFLAFVNYWTAYKNANITPIDEKSGTVILSRWQLEELTKETEKTLRQSLRGNDPELLAKIMPLFDYLVLNELRDYNPNAILVVGGLRKSGGDYVGINAVKQEAPKMDPAIVAIIYYLGIIGNYHGLDLLKPEDRQAYKQLTGVLDLRKGVLHLDSDLERAVK